MLTYFFFFNDTATTEIYTLSLHDALPIFAGRVRQQQALLPRRDAALAGVLDLGGAQLGLPLRQRGHLDAQRPQRVSFDRSEEHTSELQSRQYLVCRLLLEKKKKNYTPHAA